MFSPDIAIDRNGFAVCLECGEDNYGEGDVRHLCSCAWYGYDNNGDEVDGAPCCPAPSEHSTTDGTCDFPGYAANH